MLTLESLASRLASDPDFRSAFATDPETDQDALADTDQLTLDGLRSLLALAPDRLVNALLNNPESETEGPPEWGAPPKLSGASHA